MTDLAERDDDVLVPADLARLARLEAVIEDGVATFVKVGSALLEIRDSRLYRETHDRFEDYCQERWGMSHANAGRMIRSAEVVNLISPIGLTPPSTESQARELAPLLDQPETLREVWHEVTQNGSPTAEKIRAVVEERRPREPREIRKPDPFWDAFTQWGRYVSRWTPDTFHGLSPREARKRLEALQKFDSVLVEMQLELQRLDTSPAAITKFK